MTTPAEAELDRRIRKMTADARETGYGCYVDPSNPRRLIEMHFSPDGFEEVVSSKREGPS